MGRQIGDRVRGRNREVRRTTRRVVVLVRPVTACRSASGDSRSAAAVRVETGQRATVANRRASSAQGGLSAPRRGRSRSCGASRSLALQRGGLSRWNVLRAAGLRSCLLQGPFGRDRDRSGRWGSTPKAGPASGRCAGGRNGAPWPRRLRRCGPGDLALPDWARAAVRVTLPVGTRGGRSPRLCGCCGSPVPPRGGPAPQWRRLRLKCRAPCMCCRQHPRGAEGAERRGAPLGYP